MPNVRVLGYGGLANTNGIRNFAGKSDSGGGGGDAFYFRRRGRFSYVPYLVLILMAGVFG